LDIVLKLLDILLKGWAPLSFRPSWCPKLVTGLSAGTDLPLRTILCFKFYWDLGACVYSSLNIICYRHFQFAKGKNAYIIVPPCFKIVGL